MKTELTTKLSLTFLIVLLALILIGSDGFGQDEDGQTLSRKEHIEKHLPSGSGIDPLLSEIIGKMLSAVDEYEPPKKNQEPKFTLKEYELYLTSREVYDSYERCQIRRGEHISLLYRYAVSELFKYALDKLDYIPKEEITDELFEILYHSISQKYEVLESDGPIVRADGRGYA